MRMQVKELLDRLAAALYPYRCPLCGDVVAYDDMWCGKCDFSGGGPISIPVGIADAIAAADYSGGVRLAVLRLKNEPDKRTARLFAERIAAMLREHCPDARFDLIIPVPAAEKHLRSHGFNHARLLADQLGQITGLPVLDGLLLRREESATQHELTSEQRQLNAARSYFAGPEAALADGKAVLLVDDVLTTGATASTCASRLLESGAKSVFAAVAAHTRFKDQTV